MTAEELWNRGNNLASVAAVALAGFAFAPELIMETEWQFKIDDTLLLLLGLGAIKWYRKNALRRSVVPLVFTIIALLVKFGAIMVEMKDKEDVGDDFGGLVLFICATVFVGFLYFRRKFKE